MKTPTARVLRCLLLIAVAAPVATAQDQLWVRYPASGSTSAVAQDGAGGSFVAGYSPANPGDPTPLVLHIWLARYDGDGGQMWITELGTGSDLLISAVAPDGVGGVFAFGHSTQEFGGPSLGGYDIWLARYDGDGNQSWIRRFGSSDYDYGWSIVPDGTGGVFVGGTTGGSFGAPNAGFGDVYVARHDAAGNQLWIRQFGSTVNDAASGLTADGEGGVFFGGTTYGIIQGETAGLGDAWLARYDADGGRTWLRQFGPPNSTDRAFALAPDGAGGAYIAGDTLGSFGAPSAGGRDAWLARFDGAGTQTWVRQLGTDANEGASGLAPDGSGGVYIGGQTLGSLGGQNAGDNDLWLARYTAAGDRDWLYQLGTMNSDRVDELAPDGAGGVLVAGEWFGSMGQSTGSPRAWLARYGDAPCAADWNGDDAVNSSDISSYLTAWLDSVQNGTLEADFDGDEMVTSGDISAFLTAWLNAVQNGC